MRLAYLFRETEPPEGLDVRLHVPLADWLSARTLPNNFSNAWRQSARGIPAHPISFVLKGGQASSLRLAYLLERQNFGYLCHLVTDQRLPSGSMSPHVPLANWLSARTLPNNFSNAWRQSARGIPAHPISFVLKGGQASSLRLAYLLERQNFGYLCHLVTDQRLPSGSMSPHVPLANWLSTRTHPNKLYHLSGHAPPPLSSRDHWIRFAY